MQKLYLVKRTIVITKTNKRKITGNQSDSQKKKKDKLNRMGVTPLT